MQVPESNRALPVFVGHGTSDTLLPSFLAQATMGILKQQGIRDAEQHTYQGLGHATNAQELDDVKDWLAKVIPEARITRYTACRFLSSLVSSQAADFGCNLLITRSLLAAGKDLEKCQVSHCCNVWCQLCIKHLAAVLLMSTMATVTCLLLQQSNSRPSWHQKASAQLACWRSRNFWKVLSKHSEPCAIGK